MAIKNYLFDGSYTNISLVTVIKDPLIMTYCVDVYTNDTKKELLLSRTFNAKTSEVFPMENIPWSVINQNKENNNIFKIAYEELKLLDSVSKYRIEDC